MSDLFKPEDYIPTSPGQGEGNNIPNLTDTHYIIRLDTSNVLGLTLNRPNIAASQSLCGVTFLDEPPTVPYSPTTWVTRNTNFFNPTYMEYNNEGFKPTQNSMVKLMFATRNSGWNGLSPVFVVIPKHLIDNTSIKSGTIINVTNTVGEASYDLAKLRTLRKVEINSTQPTYYKVWWPYDGARHYEQWIRYDKTPFVITPRKMIYNSLVESAQSHTKISKQLWKFGPTRRDSNKMKGWFIRVITALINKLIKAKIRKFEKGDNNGAI